MEAYLTAFVQGFWYTLTEMSPYLLFGFLVAGLLSVLISPALVERHLGGRGLWPVVKASFFGVPLPLCSCGVIPVAASLRRHGASRGATTAFLLSTPQTGVDSIFVTYGLLGPVIAVFRPIAAFVAGLVGGAAVSFSGADDAGEVKKGPGCTGACCMNEPGTSKFVSALHYGFVTLPADIGKALMVGLILAGAISAAVPNDYLAGHLGTGIGGMLVMMAFGIPIYVCATASVPIAAALVAKGVSPGAALVFLMTGPATNAATIATVWKVMGRRTALIYFGTVAATALASGLLLDSFFPVMDIGSHFHAGHEGASLLTTLTAAALLAVLGYATWKGSVSEEPAAEEPTGMKTVLKVGGMHCSHCVAAVERALGECTGVESVKVDLSAGTATVSGEGFDEGELREKVTALGYTVEETKR